MAQFVEKGKYESFAKSWRSNGERGLSLRKLTFIVTPVIARALEKAVGKIYAQRPVEEQLLESQFA